MKNVLKLCLCSLLLMLAAAPAFAAPVRVYVGEINVVGGQNRDELKAALQPLLASRLSGGDLIAVDSPAEADALVAGTYVAIGAMFSLDAVISLPDKKTVARTYVQGNGQEQLMPTVDKLAAKLRPELMKLPPRSVVTAAPRPVEPVVAQSVAPVVAVAVPVTAAATADVVRIAQQPAASKKVWRSPKLPAAMISLAATEKLADNSRLMFVAEPNAIYGYRLNGNEFNPVVDQKLPLFKKILYLDILPLADGGTALLVTIMANEELKSQVWRVDTVTGKLALMLDNQPYFLRAVALSSGQKKLYVQKLGGASSFGEPIHSAALGTSGITVQEQLKLPKQISLYSFGQFVDKDGARMTVVLTTAGRLVVYNHDLVDLWQSGEQYGESELYMERRESSMVDPNEEPRIYLQQRLTVLQNGEVLVSKNDVLPLLGVKAGLRNGRAYGLAWNGSDLVQIWHTRSTDSYMADFYVDPATKELVQLEVSSRPNILSKGSSAITVRTVE